jgi:hypothetical protein
MTIRSTGERQPIKNQLSKLRNRALYTLSALALSPVTYINWYVADDLQQKPSSQESVISGAFNRVFGRDVIVQCLKGAQMKARLARGSEGLAYPYVPIIWLAQKHCDQISNFAADPPTSIESLHGNNRPGPMQRNRRYRHASRGFRHGARPK